MPQTILLSPSLPILKVRLRSLSWMLAGIIVCLLSAGAASACGQCLVTKRFPPFEPGSGATPALVNPLAPTVTSRLKVVVMGDSVMWGNGLKPEDKFVFLFGRDMAQLHRSMGITNADFDRLAENLQVSMEHHDVPFATQNRLVALLASMQRVIVTK